MIENQKELRAIVKVWMAADIELLMELQQHELYFMNQHFVLEKSTIEIANNMINPAQEHVLAVFETCMRKITLSHNKSLTNFLRKYHDWIDGTSDCIPMSVDFYNAWLNHDTSDHI